MNDKNKKSVLWAYVCSCRKSIVMFCVVVCVFILNFYLYSVPAKIVLYSACVCVVVLIPFGVVGFIRFKKAHNRLELMRQSPVVQVENLPKPQNLLEEDFCRLIEKDNEEKLKAEEEYGELRTALVEFYTLWVHQIKTPIAAVDLLLQSADNNENSHLVSDIGGELFKIEQYVDIVLNYLKIENNAQSDFLFKKYSLDEIVKEAVRKYAKLFVKKKIQLELAVPDCEVLTDKKWLLFVIEQLLSNSIKYTNSGKISIYMDKSEPLSLVVEDTGIGISEEELPRIFDNGFTGGNGRTNSKATGMGLYLCKSILTRLSNDIKIESVKGKGTKVTVNLKRNTICME